MKKFLSLAMAFVMTMSLVTIGAGATEYKDFTDKGEVQYEEAVAVLNKIGIITGYEDGSFKPTGALTRGAAAKIIVSLMIGSEAASSLTVAAAPYKDVPVTNTFAAVISYCKTAGYINGYSDGTFRPTGALTGYAFTKMLLGALGYNGKTEGFTGEGWIMNVAKLGNKAGLFNDFATAFQGNAGVTREAACLLALNTLKATEVEYNGTTVSVTTGDAQVSVGNTAYSYVTSNNTKINKNINAEKGNFNVDGYTLEFGEEHFPDLTLVSTNTRDDFGRPANKWSYKNLAIGTYAHTADYAYTTGADGDTDADMVKDMGLKDFTVACSNYTENGKTVALSGTNQQKLEKIAQQTANGVLVQVYLDDDNADTIKAVVAIKTQFMKVDTVKSDSVTLKKVETNFLTSTVNTVKSDEDAFKSLKDLKVGDYVLVTPLYNGSTYDVDSVAVPQVVTGTLSNIKVNAKNDAVKAITVAGTAYDMSKLWNSADGELNTQTKLNSKVDTTVYLDGYGYAIYVKDVTASNSAIIIDEITSSLVDGKIVKAATGWDTNGNALTINLGTNPTYPTGTETTQAGKVYEYTTATANSADYKLVGNSTGISFNATTNQYTNANDRNVHVFAATTNDAKYVVAGASQAKVDGRSVYYDANVKFLFLSIDADGDVTGVTVHQGVTEVGKVDTLANLRYVLNKDGDKITAVIVPNDNDAAVTANLLYFQKVTNHYNNADGKRVAQFSAYIKGEKVTNCEFTKDITNDSFNDKFFTYTVKEGAGVGGADIYTLTEYTKFSSKATSVQSNYALTAANIKSNTYFVGADGKDLNAKNATVIDLFTDDGVSYTSLDEMDKANIGFTVSYIFNDDANVSGTRTVAYLFITANGAKGGDDYVSGDDSTLVYTGTAMASGSARIAVTNYTRAGWVPASSPVTVNYDILVNGVYAGVGSVNILANQTTGAAVTPVGCQTGDDITIVITSEAPTSVSVVYLDKNGKDITSSMKATSGSPETEFTKTLLTSTLAFQVNTTATSAATYSVYEYVKDANGVSQKTAIVSDVAFDTNVGTAQTVSTFVATGESAVIVQFNFAMADLSENFAITASGAKDLNDVGGTTATTATVTITGSPDTSIKNGNTVALQATLSALESGVDGYLVTVTTADGQKVAAYVDGTTATTLGTIKVTGNVDLTKATIVVEEIATLAVAENESGDPLVTVSGTNYTITFNRDITLKDGLVLDTDVKCDNASATKVLSVTVVNGNQLLVVLDKVVESTKNIVVTNGTILDAEYAANAIGADNIFTEA